MTRWIVAFAMLGAASAFAGPMRLYQQGRVLDAAGGPITGTHDLTLRLLDGADNERFSEPFTGVSLQSGYFSLELGAASTPLDTSVFLDHGAMFLEVQVDGQALSKLPTGGYPFVVAQQALLAQESTSQQVLTDVAALEDAVAALQDDLDALSTSLASVPADLDALEQAVDAVTPTYSKTCADFAANGWASITECRQDGRWHKYGHLTSAWDDPQGWLDFHAASVNGAETRMRIGYEWYRVTVRHNNNPVTNAWIHVQEGGGRHLSFTLNAGGEMDNLYATPGDATFSNNWYASGLGNWHHFTDGYSFRSHDINTNQTGGIEVWARY